VSTWPFGDYPEGGLVPLGPHVVAYHGDALPVSNSAIVRGADATLVFDANTLRFARRLHEVAVAEGPPLRELVISHAHDDHSFGAGYFAPPGRVHAHRATRDRMQRWLAEEPEGWLAEVYADPAYYAGAGDDALELRIVVPDVVVSERSVVDLGGGVRVHVVPLRERAHTKGDLWAYVEPDDVILCGDLWFTRCEPYLASGSIGGALRAVAELRSAGGGVALPGHGPAARIPVEGEDEVERYCTWLIETVAELRETSDAEDLVERVRFRFEWERPVDFPVRIPGFFEENVRAAARDLERGPQGPSAGLG
jgi:glyoxylase-like metal-dependent hydrolase (beta-lactamase superfamily II)